MAKTNKQTNHNQTTTTKNCWILLRLEFQQSESGDKKALGSHWQHCLVRLKHSQKYPPSQNVKRHCNVLRNDIIRDWPLASIHRCTAWTYIHKTKVTLLGDLGKRTLSSWLSSPIKHSLVLAFTHPTPVDTWRCLVLIYQLELWFLLLIILLLFYSLPHKWGQPQDKLLLPLLQAGLVSQGSSFPKHLCREEAGSTHTKKLPLHLLHRGRMWWGCSFQPARLCWWVMG